MCIGYGQKGITYCIKCVVKERIGKHSNAVLFQRWEIGINRIDQDWRKGSWLESFHSGRIFLNIG